MGKIIKRNNIRKIFDLKQSSPHLAQDYGELFLSKNTLRKYFFQRKVFVDVTNQIECAYCIYAQFEF